MADISSEKSELTPETVIMGPRPWIRYWARIFDIYLFSLLGGALLGFFAPELLARTSDIVLGVVALLIWLVVESILLSVAGTTPGKSLLKIHIRRADGTEIGLRDAFTRSILVWWRGMGVGIPLISLFTLITAYTNLTTQGMTSWDRDSGFVVSHDEVGWTRVVCLVAFFVIFLGFVVIGLLEGV